MTPEFNACDPATWPVLLTTEQIAAVMQLAVPTVRKRAAKGLMVPAPIPNQTPRRWRKVDVLRHVDGGARGQSLRRVG
ncbi:MAG TPA: hypothetical protein VEA16_13635 [Vicinamibacterales bacterium]|nr:hypothetical protein [Vicinamibacterales bacterium]